MHVYITPNERGLEWPQELLDTMMVVAEAAGATRVIGFSEDPKGIHKIADILKWELDASGDFYFKLIGE